MAGNLSRDQLRIPSTWRALPRPLVSMPSSWWQLNHNVMYILLCNWTSYVLQAVFVMCRQNEFDQAEEVFTRIWPESEADTGQDEVVETTIKI